MYSYIMLQTPPIWASIEAAARGHADEGLTRKVYKVLDTLDVCRSFRPSDMAKFMGVKK
jgi:hypothetical protein